MLTVSNCFNSFKCINAMLTKRTRITSCISIAFVTRQTGAASSVLSGQAACVYTAFCGATYRWTARVRAGSIIGALVITNTFGHWWYWYQNSLAADKRRARISCRTRADGCMSDSSTDRVKTTSVNAWIGTLSVDTRPVSGAVVINYALGIGTQSIPAQTMRCTWIRIAKIAHSSIWNWRNIIWISKNQLKATINPVKILLGINNKPLSRHSRNGSPVVKAGQEHIGAWSKTRHIAPLPQAPTHGSMHLFRTQARSRWHSELTTHSGRQPVVAASPLVPVGQEHIALLPDSVQIAPGPHGDGVHGGAVGRKKRLLIF